MTSVYTSLARLGLTSLEQTTPDLLRRAFTQAVKEAHPDHGGSENDFDEVLSAYVYLTTILKRQSGGRNGLSCVDVQEVQQAREKQWIHELNNSVYEVFDSLSDTSKFQHEFNEQFEKLHVSESKGYGEWLKADSKDTTTDPLSYASLYADVHGVVNDTDEKTDDSVTTMTFHQRFESQAPRVSTDLILHPDMMASGPMLGMTLIEKDEPFTSTHESPAYCDLLRAYTSDHMMCHQLPVFTEDTRSFDDRVAERLTFMQSSYETYQTNMNDQDREIIQAYEKKREMDEKEHKQKIATYFQQTASSQWALRGSASSSP